MPVICSVIVPKKLPLGTKNNAGRVHKKYWDLRVFWQSVIKVLLPTWKWTGGHLKVKNHKLLSSATAKGNYLNIKQADIFEKGASLTF